MSDTEVMAIFIVTCIAVFLLTFIVSSIVTLWLTGALTKIFRDMERW